MNHWHWKPHRLISANILLFVLTLFMFSVQSVAAVAEIPSDLETALFNKINWVRRNPLNAAREMGIDTGALMNDKELADILVHGLPKLNYHPRLYVAARTHVEDMIERRYYDSVSPDGKTPQERVLETGYIAKTTGETLGFVGFNNFIDPDQAVQLIFENIFMDELKPGAVKNILNPDVKEVGIAVGGATFGFGFPIANAYVATCVFASDGKAESEQLMLRLINNARENPHRAIETAGYWDMAGIADLPLSSMQSVDFQDQLVSAAKAHVRDMQENLYFSNVGLTGEKPLDRVRTEGFTGIFGGEIIGAVLFEGYLSPSEAVYLMMDQILLKEASALSENNHQGIVLLDPPLTDAGIGMTYVTVSVEGRPMKLYLFVIDLGYEVGLFSGGDGSAQKYYDIIY